MERPDVLLLLLFDKNKPIVGTTRIQKLTFLVEKETDIKILEDFDFRAYLFGPASDKVYDDLNFLENLGYLEKSGKSSSIIELKIEEIERYKPEMFLSDKNKSEIDIEEAPMENIAYGESDFEDGKEIKTIKTPIDTDDQITYRITEKGLKYLTDKQLLKSEEGKKIQTISKKYSSKSLLGLLQYVYSTYPDYTDQSVIKGIIVKKCC
jgi:hypothetical protein